MMSSVPYVAHKSRIKNNALTVYITARGNRAGGLSCIDNSPGAKSRASGDRTVAFIVIGFYCLPKSAALLPSAIPPADEAVVTLTRKFDHLARAEPSPHRYRSSFHLNCTDRPNRRLLLPCRYLQDMRSPRHQSCSMHSGCDLLPVLGQKH